MYQQNRRQTRMFFFSAVFQICKSTNEPDLLLWSSAVISDTNFVIHERGYTVDLTLPVFTLKKVILHFWESLFSTLKIPACSLRHSTLLEMLQVRTRYKNYIHSYQVAAIFYNLPCDILKIDLNRKLQKIFDQYFLSTLQTCTSQCPVPAFLFFSHVPNFQS